MIRVDLPPDQLRAVIEYIAKRPNPDADTPLARAETTLDLALMEWERDG